MRLKTLIALAAIAGSLGLAGCKPKETTIPGELEARQRDMATAEFQVKVCQTNITIEEAAVDSAQQQFNQAKTNYDRFMATNPLLTNAVYVKIKKDLSVQTGLIAYQQQAIKGREDAVERSSHPGTPTWIVDEGTYRDNRGIIRHRGHWKQPDEGARIALNKACRGYLANARNELANAYAQLNADQQALVKIKNDVDTFQANKLHDAESLLNTAKSHLTEAQSNLAAAKSHLETINTSLKKN
jgi:hypothetical protein